MKYKKIGGVISFILGIVLVCYGFYGTYRMIEAKQDISQKTSYIPGEGTRGFVQERFYGEVDKYKLPVTLCYVGGALFLIIGYVLLRSSKKHS